MLLKNKVAIITGGNRGIGAATAKRFAKEGARVVITFHRRSVRQPPMKSLTVLTE